MAQPRDIDARKYYRAAKQRLAEAQLILEIDLAAAAIYLAGYAVECILKALILTRTPAQRRQAMLVSFRRELGHDLERMRDELVRRGVSLPGAIAGELAFVAPWSPHLRYEPGPGNRRDARRFLIAAEAIMRWADGRM